jgi:hypothetical protein
VNNRDFCHSVAELQLNYFPLLGPEPHQKIFLSSFALYNIVLGKSAELHHIPNPEPQHNAAPQQ